MCAHTRPGVGPARRRSPGFTAVTGRGASAARPATRRRGRAARPRPRPPSAPARSRPTPLMPYGARGCGSSTRIVSIGGTSLARMMPRPAQRHQRRAAVGVAREVLGQRVAEAHVHRALDLADALQRVDRAPDVVRGDDPLDVTRLAIEDDELRRVAERGVDHRVARRRIRSSSSSRRGTRPRSRRRPGNRRRARPGTRRPPRPRPSTCPGNRWSVPRRARASCRRSRARGPGATPSSSIATCAATVCTPWPISVQQWRTSTVPSGWKRTTARTISRNPLPRPEFFRPEPDADRAARPRPRRRTRASPLRGTAARRDSRRPSPDPDPRPRPAR